MEKPATLIDIQKLKSPLIPAAVVLYILATLAGIPGIFLLFNQEYARFLAGDLIAGGISDASSIRSWQMINAAISILTCFGPALMAIGLIITRKGKPVLGLGILSTAAQWLLYGVYASGGLCLAVFVFRFIRFLIINISHPSGIVAIYSMIISEGLMASQAVFLFFLIRKFLNCCLDSTASITYTLATGKLDDRSIPSLPAACFLILAVVGVFIACNRLFTLTIVVNVVRSYYKLLIASHPALWAEAICLILGSIANILICCFLRRYKKITEQTLYEASKSA